MKGELAVKYLIIIIIGVIALATIVAVSNNLVETAVADAINT